MKTLRQMLIENQLPVMYHGSNTERKSLQPGSMLTIDPVWAAGYTTKFSLTKEIFVGKIHVVKVNPKNDYLIPGSLHDTEDFLIKYARKNQIPGGSLNSLAIGVHEKTEWDFLIASFRGQIVGAINLVNIPVVGYLDPVQVLRDHLPNIPDNLKKALEQIEK